MLGKVKHGKSIITLGPDGLIFRSLVLGPVV